MALCRGRTTAYVLLVGYLLSVTAARYHHHAGAGQVWGWGFGGQSAIPFCWHDPFSEAASPLGPNGVARHGSGSSGAVGEHTCPICQVLSQKVTPHTAFGLVTVDLLRVRAPQAQPVRAICPLIRIERCRAPPSIA